MTGLVWRRRQGGKRAAVAGVAVALLAAAGCGSGSTGSGGGGSIEMTAAEADKTLDKVLTGVSYPIPTSSPPAQSDKTVWLLSCVAFPACQAYNKKFESAAETLGWTVRTFDNKADIGVNLTLMRQAIAAKADAIVIDPFDCAGIKTGLEAARKANIPVVSFLGIDCDETDGGEALFSAPIKINGTEGPVPYYTQYGQTDAEVMVASIVKSGLKDPKILAFQNTDQASQTTAFKAFEERVGELCSACQIKKAPFTISTLSKGPQFWRSSVLANPDANAVYIPFDSVLPLGLGPALMASPSFKILVGGDTYGGGLDFIRKSKATVRIPNQTLEFFGYATADVVNRLFAGEEAASLPNEGGYQLYVDKTHNLPAGDESVKAPFDYESQYEKLWASGK